MESGIIAFQSSQFGSVRTVERDGEAWFIANDVCKALDVAKTQIRRLDEDERDVVAIITKGGRQQQNIINEFGLYSLVLSSRKAEAKAFKRWITHEVIPAIRRQGYYGRMAGADAGSIALALQADSELAERVMREIGDSAERLERKAAALADQAQRLRRLQGGLRPGLPGGPGCGEITLDEMAETLITQGVPVGKRQLLAWLREKQLLMRMPTTGRHRPMGEGQRLGLFREDKGWHKALYVTAAGQRYLLEHGGEMLDDLARQQ